MRATRLGLALLPALWPLAGWGWEEQRVLEFVLAYHPVLEAQRQVTRAYRPPQGLLDRLGEYTAVYGRVGAGGTDYLEDPFVLQAGVQISIPLASTKERREQALKAVEEMRAFDAVRAKVLADLAQLRQAEADLAAGETQLGFYTDQSTWRQQRVTEGLGDVEDLWRLGQSLNEARANVERLRTLLRSQRYQVASVVGDQWATLLAYLEGRGALPGGE